MDRLRMCESHITFKKCLKTILFSELRGRNVVRGEQHEMEAEDGQGIAEADGFHPNGIRHDVRDVQRAQRIIERSRTLAAEALRVNKRECISKITQARAHAAQAIEKHRNDCIDEIFRARENKWQTVNGSRKEAAKIVSNARKLAAARIARSRKLADKIIKRSRLIATGRKVPARRRGAGARGRRGGGQQEE